MKRAAAISFLIHAAVAVAVARAHQRPMRGAQPRIRVAVVERSRKATEPPRPAPPKPQERPEKSPRFARAATPTRAMASSPQASAAPPPPTSEAAHPAEDVVAVAGITFESTSASGSFTVVAGNTLAATPERLARDPARAARPYKAERYAPASDLAEMPEVLNRSLVDIRRYYPKEALQRGVEGEVILRLVIDADGSIADAAVVKDPGAGMGAAALRAVREFRFAPGKAAGAAVATSIPFVIRFVIS